MSQDPIVSRSNSPLTNKERSTYLQSKLRRSIITDPIVKLRHLACNIHQRKKKSFFLFFLHTTVKNYGRNTCPAVDDITTEGTLSILAWETIYSKVQVASYSVLMRDDQFNSLRHETFAVERKDLCFQVTSRVTPIRRSPLSRLTRPMSWFVRSIVHLC
jgi:hypothetical protein